MITQTTNLDQPAERRVKKVLVACHCEGRQVWALLDAVKDGRKYKVDQSVLLAMQDKVRGGNTSKRVYWG